MTDAHQSAPEGLVPDPDPVASLLAVLDLAESDARTTEDIFTGVSQKMPLGRGYGAIRTAQYRMVLKLRGCMSAALQRKEAAHVDR